MRHAGSPRCLLRVFTPRHSCKYRWLPSPRKSHSLERIGDLRGERQHRVDRQ